MKHVVGFVERQRKILSTVFDEIERLKDTLIMRIREIAEIPSPTFHEVKRSEYVADAFRKVRLKDVERLPKGSVVGFTQSKHEADTLLLAAHIDTVFPMETDLTTRIEGSLLHGPGSGDNAANVAAIITLAEILKDAGIKTHRNLAFAGTVCEEGIGNLAGMAEVLDACGQAGGGTSGESGSESGSEVSHETDAGISGAPGGRKSDGMSGETGSANGSKRGGRKTIDVVIAVDGAMPALMHRSQAIRRYAVRAEGPGGHGWTHFGTPSAVHELARVVRELTSASVPEEPKTTFNVGTIHGGTSVNAIAQECVAEVEFRSLESGPVEALEHELFRITEAIPQAGVTVKAELIGTRPAAQQPPESDLVKIAAEAAGYVGIEAELTAASTDAALPLSRGIPSIAFGTYQGKGVHTLGEHVELDSLTTGLKWLALTVLVLAGIGE